MSITETTTDAGTAQATARLLPHWIGGAEYAPAGGRTAPVFNPATGAVSARVALADEAEIDAAIASAEAGFREWSGY